MKQTDVFTLHTHRACTWRVPWKKVKNSRPIQRLRMMQASTLPCRHPMHCSCHSKTGRWFLFSRFYYERRKVSRTKQFGMQTHRIYTGNSGGCGHSVSVIYPNYMQQIYSTHRPQTRNSVVILSPRSSSFQHLQIPTLGGTECWKRYVVMTQFEGTTPILQSVF